MKKQILLLAFFSLALIAGTSTAFGQQAVHNSAPQPLSCVPDFLHPMAGQSFNYPATASVPGTWHFWATKDANFIQTAANVTTNNSAGALTVAGGGLIATSTNYNTPGATASVDITWSTATLAGTDYQGIPGPGTPTFVAAYFSATDGCSDNFKVWELDPLNGFTVDVLAIDPDAVTTAPAYGTIPTTCVDDVESATYVTNAMQYNYGDNYLYFEFVAANFTNYWIPTFAVSGQNAVQTLTYEYTYSLPANWATATWTPLASGITQLQVDPSVTNTSNGVSVFVRVLVDHANYENTAGQTIVMTLDGQNASSEWDVVNATCAATTGPDSNDTASSTITARPAITPGATSPTAPNLTIVTGNNVN